MGIDAATRDRIAKYLARSPQAIDTGKLVLAHGDTITAVSRADYAANALRATKGLGRRTHSVRRRSAS